MGDGWCPFAIPCPGPPEKVGYNGGTTDRTHAKVGVALHSAEYESTPEWDDYKTLHNALFSSREASWTFTLCEFMGGALLFQHYPIGTVCWAQGYQGNLWLDSVETERIAPHRLTGPQHELLVKTLRWIKEEHGWPIWIGVGTRANALHSTGWLFEHNAVPGAPATNCAVFTNGQIDPVRLLNDLKEEDMDDERVREIVKELLGYRPEAKNEAVREDMAKMRVQALSVMRIVGLALAGTEESWQEARQIMDFYGWGKV